MNLLELERVTRQNDKNKIKLKDQATTIDCLKSDLQTHSQLLIRQKGQLEDAKQSIKTLKRKLEDQQMERQRMESRYLLVLQGLENELEDYKKKYSKLENKILPLMDQDSVRLKVLNEVESTHQMQIHNFKSTIENLKDEVLRYRRQNEVLKHSLENERMTIEQESRRVKGNKQSDFAQETINYLTFSMWKDMEAKLKASYQQARKEAEFYKEKYFIAEKKYQNKMQECDRAEADMLKGNRRL